MRAFEREVVFVNRRKKDLLKKFALFGNFRFHLSDFQCDFRNGFNQKLSRVLICIDLQGKDVSKL